jgi:hypothetical protein
MIQQKLLPVILSQVGVCKSDRTVASLASPGRADGNSGSIVAFQLVIDTARSLRECNPVAEPGPD